VDNEYQISDSLKKTFDQISAFAKEQNSKALSLLVRELSLTKNEQRYSMVT